MLACIAPDMSTRKRRGSSLFFFDQPGLPDIKRPRKETNNNPKVETDVTKLSRVEQMPSMYYSNSHVRRTASIKAEIAISSLIRDSTSPSQLSSAKPYEKLEEDEEEVSNEEKKGVEPGVEELKKKGEKNEQTATFFRPNKISHTLFFTPFEHKTHSENYSASPSPLSSLGTWEEERGSCFEVKQPLNLKKTLALTLVDCKKSSAKPQEKKKSPLSNNSWYVKRMASLNARACVSVLMESTRRPSKPKQAMRQALIPPRKNGDIPKHSSLLNSSGSVSARSSPAPQSYLLRKSSSRQSSADRDDANSCGSSDDKKYVFTCASQLTLERNNITEVTESTTDDEDVPFNTETTDNEDVPFNTEGLLWNGDTLHPQSRLFLCADGSVPRWIFSPVRPIKPTSVLATVAKTQHQKKHKRAKALKV